MDGNGRTSRVVSYAIAHGTGDKQELHDILAGTYGGGNWQITPIPLVTSPRSNFKGNQPNRIEWEDAFAGEAEDALGGVIANSDFKDSVIRRFIESHGAAAKAHIEQSTSQNDDGTSALNGEAFISGLVNDPEAGITNARELLDIHREVRADYVHRYLKAMQVAERYEPRNIRPGDFELADTDTEFGRRRKLTIIKEVGRRALDGMLTPAEQQLIQHRAYSRIRQEKEV